MHIKTFKISRRKALYLKKMEEKQLEGKNIIVTGANCGIGYEAALELAKRGPYF